MVCAAIVVPQNFTSTGSGGPDVAMSTQAGDTVSTVATVCLHSTARRRETERSLDIFPKAPFRSGYGAVNSPLGKVNKAEQALLNLFSGSGPPL